MSFSDETLGALQPVRRFLFERMYRHDKVRMMIAEAKEVVRSLFAHYQADVDTLPEEWRRQAEGLADVDRARLVADYIAGMTDRFALDEHHRLFDPIL